VGRYQEANPALFTIVTFPFLFGVMYGDVGHGMIVMLGALFMICNEKKYLEQQRNGTINEMFGMAFSGRYMLVLMGFFGVYVGSLYNDCMAMPLPLFDSMWFVNETTNQYQRVEGRVYPWGADWAWYNKKNQLFFFNSFKMKLSVILGVTQMMFGLFLSLSNALFFKDWAAVWLEFVPQVVFLMCTFGYMIIIIFYKWCVDWTITDAAAPNLVQTMIGMFLRPGSVDENKQLYSGQGPIQLILLLCALCAVPVMLFGKPYAMKKAREKAKHRPRFSSYNAMADGDAEMEELDGSGPVTEEEEHGEHSFGDDMIHQFIHTIEFVLGCVSNTASYLRLWALSLAHAQLAQVFWDRMMMQYGINTGNPIMAFIGFGVWAMATFFVLLCMDVLECFLHALRLHWVEFQNKFYRADGYPADFFSFTKEKAD
jgi:V-type H+-transporting ATPase subunit a